jgi:hypothetical protein
MPGMPLYGVLDLQQGKLMNIIIPDRFFSDEYIAGFASLDGCRELHRSWRDNMLQQGRVVSETRMSWGTLSAEDKQLDQNIAYDVVRDFVTFLMGHAHYEEARSNDD